MLRPADPSAWVGMVEGSSTVLVLSGKAPQRDPSYVACVNHSATGSNLPMQHQTVELQYWNIKDKLSYYQELTVP